MNHLKRYSQQLTGYIVAAMLLPGIFAAGTVLVVHYYLQADAWIVMSAGAVVFTVSATLFYIRLARISMGPVEKIWQAVWHISPQRNNVAAPKLESLKTGRELVRSVIQQIYELAGSPATTGKDAAEATSGVQGGMELVDAMPLALFVIDKDRGIRWANRQAGIVLGEDPRSLAGKSMYDVLKLSFTSDDTLDNWLTHVSTTRAIDTRTWEHVRLTPPDNKSVRQFDLAATYSKENPAGNELMLALFDKTELYSKLDQSAGYVAVAVHELRTPLTLLRGYIEVFEDELGDKLTPELSEFMRKMNASAQTLTAFVSNILNIARIDENQLVLNLQEADWPAVLTEIIDDLSIRATVRGKKLKLNIAPGLPAAAIDRISMYEVVSNLVDNAIKYSGQSSEIIIHTRLGKSGSIETEIQDFGPGMPQSAMDGLFTRYYRSHRSRNAVSGSGLGLYIVKSIVSAHGGNVWVNSKEGQGSTFGFSIQTYENAKDQAGSLNKDGIERQAGGWIKNHSLYRR